jgi:hypothetical protein
VNFSSSSPIGHSGPVKISDRSPIRTRSQPNKLDLFGAWMEDFLSVFFFILEGRRGRGGEASPVNPRRRRRVYEVI